MALRALLLTSAAVLLILIHRMSAADPSSCRAVWLFKMACSQPRAAVVEQVKAWSSRQCYDSEGEECSYQIVTEAPGYVEIKHTNLSSQKSTALNFTFKPPDVPSFCSMRGLSTTAPPGGSSPYCVLHNLVNGSGLTQEAGFREICNAAMCPSMDVTACGAA
ncbi:hypothetical protein OJAV_G00092850 [Oryzias javanicus]|uniref:Uncharacterized protein n=1 Tax=Oryzias javanicus TaxID=123683 RepID=A0A3S2UDK6_ORYJA|nr:hypothetical protein OJAV_G00092850 [Oryzias javanicus]